MLRRAGMLLTMAAVTILAAACDGKPALTGPGGVSVGIGGGGGGFNQPDGALLGNWRRTIFLLDVEGFPHSSETTWRFFSGGTAVRTIVARDLTFGVADVQVTDLRWTADATTVRVTFLPPASGTAEYSWRVRGDTLELASQPYIRLRE